MNVAKALVAGVSAFVTAVVTFIVVVSATTTITEIAEVWDRDLGEAARLALAVLTGLIWLLAPLAVLVITSLKGAQLLNIPPRLPVLVAIALAAAPSFLSIFYTSAINDCMWGVPFPLAEDCGFR